MSKVLHLHNTLTRKIEPFEPMSPGRVGLYTCGPTVYSYAHIGNMRSYVFADTLRRSLEYFGYDVKHVMNITDVGHLSDDADAGEDKVEVEARRAGMDAWAVAEKYTKAFFEDTDRLNIRRPTIVCKATDHIAEQIAMVSSLEVKGYTYKTGDGVYFDTSKFPTYASLGRLDVAGMQEGHRVELGEKRHKTDFALWKFSKPEERRAMEWDSPWGRGFPGWHIECSAMSMKYLGDQFDIHTGGVDHIPIHHTNEVAQGECSSGKSPVVRYWMHNEFLVLGESSKMSKSAGGTTTLQSLVDDGFHPMAFRVLCLQSHYRKQLKFTKDNLTAAAKCFDRLHEMTRQLRSATLDTNESDPLSEKAQRIVDKFRGELAQDLNTPQAFATVWSAVHNDEISQDDKRRILALSDAVLGLDVFADSPEAVVPEDVKVLVAERDAARKSKDWSASDRLRDKILALGYDILDGQGGTEVKKRLG